MLTPDRKVVFSPQAVLALPHRVTDCEAPGSKATAIATATRRCCAAFIPASWSGPCRPGWSVASALVLSSADARALARALERPRRRRKNNDSPGCPIRFPRNFPLSYRPRSGHLLLQQQAEEFVRAAKAPSTLRAYRSDWDHFRHWCDEHTLCPLPASPETVALYLAALAATHRPATMTRRLTAITKAHQIAGHPSPATMQQPAVSETLKGIRRTLGTAQQIKAPLLTADVRRMVEALPDNLAGRRDRALLLLGFAGGFRRSELAALDVEDVLPTEDGLVVKLRRSKTDPEGKGRDVGIPYGSTPSTCPVRALTAWMTAAGISEGALFRGVDRHGRVGTVRLHKDSVGLVVKRAAEAAGLDPGKVCRPFLARRTSDAGVFEWCRRTRHHAPDRPPLARHGPPLYPRWLAFPGKSGGQTGALKRTDRSACLAWATLNQRDGAVHRHE